MAFLQRLSRPAVPVPNFTWCQRRQLRCNNQYLQRFNSLNIQMLTESLHKQIFGKQDVTSEKSSTNPEVTNDADLKKIQAHLQKFGLLKSSAASTADVDLELPKLNGCNIDEHFRYIANKQIKDYKQLADTLAQSNPPPMPDVWVKQKGWTKYYLDGRTESVPFPSEDAIVFDIECLVTEGNFPTIAAALSASHW